MSRVEGGRLALTDRLESDAINGIAWAVKSSLVGNIRMYRLCVYDSECTECSGLICEKLVGS